jgi:predicted acetyltransferase
MVQVVLAGKADEETLNNLLQLYLHDFSEFDGSQISSDGWFEYPYLSRYWDEPDRYAFLFKVEGSLAGFALVKKGSEIAEDDESMDVAEFFVLRSHRLKGVGQAAFEEIVRKFPGPWIARVQDEYHAALAFWRRVIPAVASSEFGSEVIDDGRRKWIVLKFEFSDPDGAGSIGSTSSAAG